jgi:ArsR family transcriptional regulator
MNETTASPDCCEIREISERPAGERQEIVALFKALADPTRFEIFRLIAAQSDSICVCHITDRFDVSQPTISHHLKVLREVGLISVSRRGVWAYYAVDSRGLEQLQSAVGDLVPAALVGAF